MGVIKDGVVVRNTLGFNPMITSALANWQWMQMENPSKALFSAPRSVELALHDKTGQANT